MATKLNYGIALGMVCVTLATARSAMAISIEIAKKCGALTDNAYPLRALGNPAAGRERGTAKEARDYFNKCIAKGGNIDEQTSKPANRPPRPDDGGDWSDQVEGKKRTFPDGLL
jgi:hypothetical protein